MMFDITLNMISTLLQDGQREIFSALRHKASSSSCNKSTKTCNVQKSPNKRKPLRSSLISNYKSSHRQMQRSAETYNHYETDDDDYNDLIDDDRNDDDQVIVA